MESTIVVTALVPLVYVVAMLRFWRSTSALAAFVLAVAVTILAAFNLLTLTLSSVQEIMLLLVTGLGWIVSRFSEQYLAGDPGQPRFYCWLNALLASVLVVVVADNLLLLWTAWVAISLSLHQLLVFYPERARAALAAHKKFVFARLADLALLVAIGLIYWQHQTLSITALDGIWRELDTLPLSMQFAAVLVVITALLKCAQLPFHGWLIQVVEAPTPVSALLHAGVVNLGGFLLLRLAGLLELAAVATGVLLIVAGASLVLAGLVAVTRISIKVALAWSTVAQMALMLLQIGLGLYALAILHLVAHSCYKAYSFLNSGSQVQHSVMARVAPGGGLKLRTAMLGSLIAMTAYLTLTQWFSLPVSAAEWLLLALYSIGFGCLWRRRGWLLSLGMIVALVALHLVFKAGAQMHLEPAASPAGDWALIWTATVIAALGAGGWLVMFGRNTTLHQDLYRSLYAGLYLDEWATRLTLRLWPARLPEPSPMLNPVLAKETRP
ncbi:NADH-quinone oxidoreductase subunit L [Halopseudomonas salina]|uniref:Probable inorganic carbon transporter subunit DabB n=1 Tax=Halopseudomonas salina TaxID=1323744 RepID=A0ABQ1NSL5_9GAMM|nr:NADH-quinone oxidoreductase subunit L [Halopseudomonas salina]GGC84428.1 NADH dehydrogenase subunit L [Halopseudomonas salina]